MIIKSMSRKEPSFDQLASYMTLPKGAQICIAHNLPASSDTPEKIIQQFSENHALLPNRANGNAMFHEIIALEPNAKLSLKQQVAALRIIAARYLERRAQNQLAFGVIHSDTAHVHIHLMISSNAVLSRKRVWLKKRDFADIQREMEAYRLAKYPELGAARHYDQSHQGMKRSSREQEASLRSEKLSHKQALAANLETVLQNARSRKALDAALAVLGLALYQRGRSVGVQTLATPPMCISI